MLFHGLRAIRHWSSLSSSLPLSLTIIVGCVKMAQLMSGAVFAFLPGKLCREQDVMLYFRR